MKAKSRFSSPATQMAAILSQSQLTALFGRVSTDVFAARPASSGVAIAEGWMDISLPLMEQVYEASTAIPLPNARRLTGALEGRRTKFRRYSKRYAAGAQRDLGDLRSLFTLLSDARLRRGLLPGKSTKARWQNGR